MNVPIFESLDMHMIMITNIFKEIWNQKIKICKNNKTENYLIKTNNHQGLMASWIWQYTNIQDARLWEEREYVEWEREERER